MKLYYANTNLDSGDVITLGLSYDRTSPFIAGSRFGPEYIRLCFENIEDYSSCQGKNLYEIMTHDTGDVYLETQDWKTEVHKALGCIRSDKNVIVLGGKHTVTLPVVTWCKANFRAFSVIHFDAHCDLRDEYLEQKICHATVMRRVSNIIGLENLYQFGVRSGTKRRNFIEYEFT